MWKTPVQSLGQGDPLKKEMATHSSILAWRILSTGGAWWVTVHAVAESHVAEQLTDRRVHAWRTQTYVVGTENGVWELAYSPHSWQREHQPKRNVGHG